MSASDSGEGGPITETRVLSPEEEVHSECTEVARESAGETRWLHALPIDTESEGENSAGAPHASSYSG